MFELEDLRRLGIEEDELKDLVDRLGMSLESLDDQYATIDITPNRADMLDINGFARAASFLNAKKTPKERFYSIKNGPATRITVTAAVKKTRPFVAAAIVKNVDLKGNRLKYLINFTEKFCETYGRKRKKIAIGLHNLDVVSGQLTYDASRSGSFVPLGSEGEQSFADILKSHEKGIEYAKTLGKSNVYPFISDSKGVLSLIPIINSERTKVTNDTRNLLIELTGTSENSVEEAINLIACSFMDLGADIYPCEIAYKNKTIVTPNLEYKSIRVRRSTIEKTLGVYLEENRIINLANRLGHVAAKYGNYTLVYAPPYRLDVLNEQDIIEDLAIAYGYNNIEPQPVLGFFVGMAEESKDQANRIAKLMLGLGFTEAINPYLTNEDLNFRSLDRKYDENSIISVAYAKTEAITMLRTDLLPWLMHNLGNSSHERMPQKLFEIGSVFRLENGKPVESTNISMVSEHSRVNYSEIKSVVSQLLKFNNMEYTLKELSDSAFIEGRCAKIVIGNETIGYFGEIAPKILDNFRLEEPVVAAELRIDKIFQKKSNK